MPAAAAIARARQAAEALMVDTVAASRPTGGWTTGPGDTEVPAYAALFTSPARIQARAVQALTAEAGGRTAVTVRYEAHLPIAQPMLKVGDELTVTAVGPGSDPQKVGWRLRVTAPDVKTFASARRYPVEAVVA